MQVAQTPRRCLRDPVPAIADAARSLDAAVTAHLNGRRSEAAELIRDADRLEIREWVESLWGKNSQYNKPRKLVASREALSPGQRAKERMPDSRLRRTLLDRDGFHCRFCGIPVVRREVRARICRAYPELRIWGKTNSLQHAAFQAMWVQYDHVVPHAFGGQNDLENMVIACAPCNFGRVDYSLEEMDLADPRLREPVASTWDGLERFK